jgi:transposase InsO family protein
LLKLGIPVSKRTIQKYLKQKPRSRPRGQTWSTFVHNHAADIWVAQQWRDATPFGTNPKYLIRDNDKKYRQHFAAATAGTDVLRTPIHAPRANAFCERLMGSLRRECLDHVLILSEKQLRRHVKEYVRYYNEDRPHQGIDHCLPIAPESPPAKAGTILARPVLSGLHHAYSRKVA